MFFRQQTFDEKRMDQLTSSLIAMRKKEKVRNLADLMPDSSKPPQKPKLSEKDQFAI